jgi:peptidoglycan/xylan/chitin deacetylase (PgdA/CDA1 family)
MTPEKARALHANEMGEIPVLMYHLISHTNSQFNRTPDEFRNDIADLITDGYYPVNVRDLASGNLDVPAGKSPVVITFDDSSEGQYRILPDGSLDPNCAVAIMNQAADGGGWAKRASFYPLIDVTPPDHDIFGQPDLQQEKLRDLVAWGYEVGSHTVTHLNLKTASTKEATKQLEQSQATLESMIGADYQVTSLALPFGEYPANDAILASGTYQGHAYHYTAALKEAGGPAFSPFSSKFQALHINRIQVTGNTLKSVLALLNKHPELRYVSDGDPTTISAPRNLPAQLGTLRNDTSRPIVRY